MRVTEREKENRRRAGRRRRRSRLLGRRSVSVLSCVLWLVFEKVLLCHTVVALLLVALLLVVCVCVCIFHFICIKLNKNRYFRFGVL